MPVQNISLASCVFTVTFLSWYLQVTHH